MKTLDEIGIDHRSDKSSLVHGYLEAYEEFLKSYQDKSFTLLEIGGRTISAAKTWSEFFPKAEIVIADTHLAEGFETVDHVTTVQLERFDKRNFMKLVEGFTPDVIIDDASHVWAHQKLAFEILYPFLNPGGIYIVEDLQTSFGDYQDKFGDGGPSAFEYFKDLMDLVAAGTLATATGSSFEHFFKDTVKQISLIRQAICVSKSPKAAKAYFRSPISKSEFSSKTVTFHSSEYSRVDGQVKNATPRVQQLFDTLKKEQSPSLGKVSSALMHEVSVISGGMVADGRSRIFAETLNCYENVPETHHFTRGEDKEIWFAKSTFPLDYIPKADGRQHVLLKSAWDSNYGHWLYDTLTKLALLKSFNLEKPPFFVVNPQKGGMRTVVENSLQLAGYGPDDYIELDHNPRRFESLVVLGSLSKHPVKKAPEGTQFLEQITKPIAHGRAQRIYLSRNEYSRRKLTNEEELWPIFERHGFVKVFPEKLTFLEQVSLFKGAKIVTGNLGAGFSNLAFAPNGIKVLPLATPAMAHDFFYDIVCHKGGSYTAIQGSSTDLHPTLSSDFSIDSKLLTGILEENLQ